MGVTCKTYGKYESFFKKLDNQLNGVKNSAPKKKKEKEAPVPTKKRK